MKTHNTSILRLLTPAVFAWLSAPAATVLGGTLIPMHSVWRYLDDGSDQGTAWYAPSFDDSGWDSGPAQLGYGNGDEATLIDHGGNPGAKYITTYFRHSFVVGDTAAYSDLYLRLLRDDGAVVYLNGREVARVGIPAGPVDYLTLATECAIEGKLFVGRVLGAGLLVNGVNVLAVEIHQVSPVSSDISFDLELSDEPEEFTRIVDLETTSAVFAAPASLSLTAKAGRPSGVTKMELLVNGAKVGERSMYNTLYATFPCTFETPTNCSLAVAATDLNGTVRTAAVDVVVEAVPDSLPAITLVGTGANWKYLDDGSDQGVAWRSPGFDDATWPAGPAVLGHGLSGIVTVTRGGAMTTYFRHAFEVSESGRFAWLKLQVLRDDGVKVYLNGSEVFRNNLPSDPVAASTSAVETMDSDEFISSAYIDASVLVPGENVLAVEMHQVTTNATMLRFDLELVGLLAPRLSLQRTAPDQTRITWPHPSTGYQLMETPTLRILQWTVVTDPQPVQAGDLYEVQVPPTGSERYYRLQKQ